MSKRKNLIIIVVIIAIIASILAISLFFFGSNNKDSTLGKNTQANTTTAPSNSVVKDTNGQNVVENNNPALSSTKAITLSSPTDGAKIVNGSVVSGMATVGVVYYRIKDDIRGVIGQGTLSVIDGKYSGVLAVSSSGAEGTFEVYSLNASTGAEENNIKIKVTF